VCSPLKKESERSCAVIFCHKSVISNSLYMFSLSPPPWLMIITLRNMSMYFPAIPRRIRSIVGALEPERQLNGRTTLH